MRIIVAGCGKVGMTVAEHLCNEGHALIVIDTDDRVLQKCEDNLDVMCIKGNAANIQTLMEAGAEEADIAIAITASDEINMLSCMLMKSMGTKYTIARVRDPEYNNGLALLKKDLGLDLPVNPELAAAIEISQLLRLPFAETVETFAKGRVEMVAFKVAEGDPIVGIPIMTIPVSGEKIPRVLYAMVEREGEITIPNGDFVIKPGDRVHVAGEPSTISAYFRQMGRQSKKAKHAMIIGGGRISYYLAKLLQQINTRAHIIEINAAKAEKLSVLLPEADVLIGDGTERDFLEQEGLRDMDAFVSLGDSDEENIMMGLYAAKAGLKRVVIKNNHRDYSDFLEDLNLESVVRPKVITAETILRYVRARVNSEGSKVERLYRLADGSVEALEFIVGDDDDYIGVQIMNLDFADDTLIAMIIRNNKIIIPFGRDTIERGDHVVVVTKQTGVTDLNTIIRR